MDEFLQSEATLEHLKNVSRKKHQILEKYLLPWSIVLGSNNRTLSYIDCFAGPGRYESQGLSVEGSALIAVRSVSNFASTHPHHKLVVVLVENDSKQVKLLNANLKSLEPLPTNLTVKIISEDSHSFIPELLAATPLPPTFFFIDSYGHPLAIPVINKILAQARTEVLINLMWFGINRDLNNPLVQERVDKLFGQKEWREQPFMKLTGAEREKAFLEYFRSRIGAKFTFPFRIKFDVEDKRAHGTKYYLLYACNHVDGVLLMKEVMYSLGDEAGTFNFSGETQGILISQTPTDEELREALLEKFSNQELSFDEIREKTWELPFIEKNYRQVIKKMREEGIVRVTPISSKKLGLKERDKVLFQTTRST